MSVVLGGRECIDALYLIAALSDAFRWISVVFLCLLSGGKGMHRGMRRCIPFDFCSVFLCLLFGGKGMRRCIPLIYVCSLGVSECASAFRLISFLYFYVCCFGGKGMRRCIPFDFCSVFLCLLFWGGGDAQMHSVFFFFFFFFLVFLIIFFFFFFFFFF